MGRLTKAGFARSKSALGLKGKLTRKQVQRVFKHAIKKLGRTRRRVSKTGKVYYTKPKRRKKSNPKRRKRRMARRKKRRGGKSLQRQLFKWIRVGALVAPGVGMGVAAAKKGYGPDEIVDQVLQVYTGYSFVHRKFDFKWLVTGWGPFLAATLMTYGIPKIAGILRRL